jgi:hypothetical protein
VKAYILINFTHAQQTKHFPTKHGNDIDEITWAARSQRILGNLFITTITKTITILSGPFSTWLHASLTYLLAPTPAVWGLTRAQ